MKLPHSSEVLEAELAIVRDDLTLGWEHFRDRFDAATLDSPFESPLRPAPLGAGRLRTHDGWHTLELFCGGRGRLTAPDGTCIPFVFDARTRLHAVEATRHLPRASEILEAELESYGKSIAWADLAASWDTARALVFFDPFPFHDGWSYSPWIGGRLRTRDGWYSVAVFLGGRGALHAPDGSLTFFQLTPPAL